MVLAVIHIQDQFLARAYDNQANSPVSVVIARAIHDLCRLFHHVVVDIDTKSVSADVVINIQTASFFLWLPYIIFTYWCLRPLFVPSVPSSALLILIRRQVVKKLDPSLRYFIGDLARKWIKSDTRFITARADPPRLLFAIRDGGYMESIWNNAQHQAPFVVFEGRERTGNKCEEQQQEIREGELLVSVKKAKSRCYWY